jgi:hypothetical protein
VEAAVLVLARGTAGAEASLASGGLVFSLEDAIMGGELGGE